MSEIERTPRGDVDLALPLNLPPHLLTIPSHSVRLDLLPGTMFGGLSKGQVSVTATQVMSRGGYEGKINGESNGGALHRARQHSVASYSRMGPSAPSSPIRVVTHRGGAWFHSQHVALLTPPAPPLTRAQLNGHSKVFVETSSDVILSRKYSTFAAKRGHTYAASKNRYTVDTVEKEHVPQRPWWYLASTSCKRRLFSGGYL